MGSRIFSIKKSRSGRHIVITTNSTRLNYATVVGANMHTVSAITGTIFSLDDTGTRREFFHDFTTLSFLLIRALKIHILSKMQGR